MLPEGLLESAVVLLAAGGFVGLLAIALASEVLASDALEVVESDVLELAALESDALLAAGGVVAVLALCEASGSLGAVVTGGGAGSLAVGGVVSGVVAVTGGAGVLEVVGGGATTGIVLGSSASVVGEPRSKSATKPPTTDRIRPIISASTQFFRHHVICPDCSAKL